MAKIIIVGGGVAGLTAGVCAQMNGYDAVIYEKHQLPGGNLTGWDRGGYHIDNCIHWLTGTNPVTDLYRLWNNTGALGDVEIYQADALYTYEKNGVTLSLSRDVNRLYTDMLALSPQDDRQIRSFIRAINAAKTLVDVSSKHNDQKTTTAQLLASLPLLMRYHRMTTRELGERFTHPVIKGFLECLLPPDFGALGLLVALGTFCSDNGGIPRGGSRAMARRMADRFCELGGELYCGKAVTGVQIQNGRAVAVTTDDGRTEEADDVILAVDPAFAFGDLLDKHYMPAGLKMLYDHPLVSRFSSVHCAFSCDCSELPFAGDHIFTLPKELQQEGNSDYLILREYAHEGDFAPAGKSLIQTMVYCSEKECRRFIELKKDPAAYREYKKAIADETMALIERRYPVLQGKLQCLDVWTPATYKRYTGADVGSYMGFVFPKKLNPIFMSGQLKGLANVYLATQWQQAPGGLPVAAKAGEAAIKAILKRDQKKVKA